jgi:ribokinase
MPTAYVAGSINRDIVAYVDRHPAPGETVLGRRSATFPGGKGANQAVAIARMGGTVRMIGCVGNDAFGAEMTAFLASEGVDVSAVAVAPGVATGIALITVDQASQNTISVIPGANHAWTKPPELQCGRGDAVVCQLEVPLDIVAAAFRQARAAGATTILNPAPYQPLPAELQALADIVILNEIELAQMTGRPAQDLRASVQQLLDQGMKTVIVTLGADGAILATTGGQHTVPGRAVAARDTTGAGDCFAGAFVAGMLRGATALDAITFANRAASISVTRDGAAVSFPTRAEIALAS